MEEPGMNDRDSAQRAKLIFLVVGALVTILLVWSLYMANKAKTERDALRQEIETVKKDNAKMEMLMKDQNGEIDVLKKKLHECESRPAPKPEVKKKKSSEKTKSNGKKAAKKSKHKHAEDR